MMYFVAGLITRSVRKDSDAFELALIVVNDLIVSILISVRVGQVMP
jgi:hypothetical protein